MKRIGGIATFLLGLATFAEGAVVQVNPGDFVSPTVLTLAAPAFVDVGGTYTENGATFSSATYFYVYQESESGLNILDLYAQVNGATYLSIVFSQPTIRFGFDTGDLGTSNPMEAYTISSVEFYSDDAFANLIDTFATPVDLGPGAGFYGLQADNAFRALRINFQDLTDGGFSPYLDDFRFDAASVPEPSMFGLVGALAAIGGILMGRRRKQN